jgi:hypothetical protein
MKQDHLIPIYAADGKSLGFRTLEAAERLVSGSHVKPAYGRKGRLKAIFLPREDGGNPADVQAPHGTRYSFLQPLDSGRCWSLQRLDVADEDGNRVTTRSDYFRVPADCMRP